VSVTDLRYQTLLAFDGGDSAHIGVYMSSHDHSDVLQQLLERVGHLEEEMRALRTRTRGGPKSDQPMTEEHAYRVRFGDLKDATHKDAAEALGLSYGQVFSCRGVYTFKSVKADWKPSTAPETPDGSKQRRQPAAAKNLKPDPEPAPEATKRSEPPAKPQVRGDAFLSSFMAPLPKHPDIDDDDIVEDRVGD